LRAADERLATSQSFHRFVARVSGCAGRWTAHLGVAEADRDDVLQDALLRMYRRREAYDPAAGSRAPLFVKVLAPGNGDLQHIGGGARCL
jgi:DNA-directed RNA polymerase specialized sigma24 family protein